MGRIFCAVKVTGIGPDLPSSDRGDHESDADVTEMKTRSESGFEYSPQKQVTDHSPLKLLKTLQCFHYYAGTWSGDRVKVNQKDQLIEAGQNRSTESCVGG